MQTLSARSLPLLCLHNSATEAITGHTLRDPGSGQRVPLDDLLRRLLTGVQHPSIYNICTSQMHLGLTKPHGCSPKLTVSCWLQTASHRQASNCICSCRITIVKKWTGTPAGVRCQMALPSLLLQDAQTHQHIPQTHRARGSTQAKPQVLSRVQRILS